MMNIDEIKDNYKINIYGKTIAVVYIFEGDDSQGLKHFYIWKGKILTQWIDAIYELHGMPLIMDVRTFVDKAINNTLPKIDYVLNLNSGTYDLSTMALIPSICSAIQVPCIPCNAISIVTGENKLLSNHIAKSIGLNIPSNLEHNKLNGIFRPINLGNSMGVARGLKQNNTQGIYQEFIPGYDITTPIVYNPITEQLELLPSVMYIPENKSLEWFYGETEKIVRNGFTFKLVDLDDELTKKYKELAKTLQVSSFCRIDARVKKLDNYYHVLSNNKVNFNDTYFIEINTMPTIRENNSFNYSYNSIDSNNSFYHYSKLHQEIVGSNNINTFLLSSAICSHFKTMY